MTSADVSARVAWAEDAPAIAAVQVRAWRTSYADLLPAEVLDALDPDDIADGWRDALGRPGRRPQPGPGRAGAQPGHRLRGDRAGRRPRLRPGRHRRAHRPHRRPAQARRRATARGCSRPAPTPWSPTGSPTPSPGCPPPTTTLRAFLTAAGWGPDGAHRTLDLLGDGTHHRQAGAPAHRAGRRRADGGATHHPLDRPRRHRRRHRHRRLRHLLRRDLGGQRPRRLAVVRALAAGVHRRLAVRAGRRDRRPAATPFFGALSGLLLGTRNTLYGLKVAPMVGWRG